MKQKRNVSKQHGSTRKVVAPVIGATTFFVSTKGKRLSAKPQFLDIHHHGKEKQSIIYNLLVNKHYFRLALAKHPLALVIGVEGQIKPITTMREVAE